MQTKNSLSLMACFLSALWYPLPAVADVKMSLSVLEPLAETEFELGHYWVSEKLDGIRALWTGKELLTRKGNKIHAPQWFIQSLPNIQLEGELWAGKGNFDMVQNTVLDHNPNEQQWANIRYMLFDLPNGDVDFRSRYEKLFALVEKLQINHVGLIAQSPVTSHKALMQRLERTNNTGGEGLMLRNIHQQSSSLVKPIKIKKHMDSEATIIGYKQGNGKYQGKVGALIVKLDDGRILSVGSGLTDLLRSEPPALGERITYRHNGFTSTGLPRFVRFVRVRQAE
ncbi:DNA ligase [Vibrio sp. TH_r3]|uniref:DNA ligase n=1 Tax=Vibrio sp. TH_r3 TaxID=3082084 RepID=UPI0029547DD8|nr:DNA ligase [Vibrio sp. TH_r3]MDV7104406.1 DNA ligase [Vibrio sp. TH_r3]